MPTLSDPPEVEFDGDGIWLATVWAPDGIPETQDVQKGRPDIPHDGVEWLHMISYFSNEVPRVCRKRVAGPDAPATQKAGATILTVGTHTVRIRRMTATEVFVRDLNPFTVG